jgi:hypothetical protein
MMEALERNSWWGLLALSVMTAVRGLGDLANGITWQAADVAGSTPVAIAAQSDAGLELSDFAIRTAGLYLFALGLVLSGVVVFAYREERRWAWWAMWALPAFVAASSGLMQAFGAWGPAITGAGVAVLAALILLAGTRRFFGQSAVLHPGAGDAEPAASATSPAASDS